jgi:hemerythrin-like domain-containing protein
MRMSITIGAPREHGFDEPLGILSDCHRRVEKFLSVLAILAAKPAPHQLDEGERAALCRALDYFRKSAPKHTADEEESLFPRLRTAGAAAELERLEEDHRDAAPRHQQVETIGRRWLECMLLPDADRDLFADAVGALNELYREHIALEEREVFPLAQRVLTPSELAEVGREMAERRGVKLSEPSAGVCET